MAHPLAAHGPPPSHSDGHRPREREYAETPLLVTWEVTQACELTCEHCRADAQPDRHPDELSTREGIALLDQIAGFGPPEPILVFSGGDPLERADLFELIQHSTELGLSTAVTPAPTPRLDSTTLERFAELGVSRVALSLDGATAARHDRFRGEAGSYGTIRRAAARAAQLGLPIQINTTVTGRTVHDLPGIANLVEQLGAVMWEVFFLVPIGRGTALEPLAPGHSDRIMEWLYRRGRDAPFRVITVEAPHYRRVAKRVERELTGADAHVGSTGDGKGFIFVSHLGEVYPSGFLPMSVGDVRDDDIVSLYRNAPLLQRLRDPDGFSGPCGQCPHRSFCGGSRARAFATTGDPLASDPLCPRVTDHGSNDAL